MHLDGTSMFVRKDFAFYDCNLSTVLGHKVMALYEILRRFVLRGKAQSRQMYDLKQDRFIVACLSQTRLAEKLETDTKGVRALLQPLYDAGWVRKIPSVDFGPNYYILGEMVPDMAGRGAERETFYADVFLRSLVAWLEPQARVAFPHHVPPKEDEEDPGYRKLALSKASDEWKLGKVREFLENHNPLCSDMNTGEGGNTPEHVPRGRNPLGGGGAAPLGGGETAPSQIENTQVENFQAENEEALARLAPPHSTAGSNEQVREDEQEKQIPRDVAHPPTSEERVLTESGEYPSVPPPPPGPTPKWLAESPGVAVGNGLSRSCDRVVAPNTAPKVGPPPPPPAAGGNLTAVVEQAQARSRKVREQQVKKAEAKEAKIRALGGKPVPLSRKKQLQTLEETWRFLMEDKFPGIQIAAWEGRERGQVWNLVEKYTGEIVKEALQYLVERWDEIRTRMLKGKGGVPSVGFLLRFHDVLVVESQLWTEYRHVKKQVDDYYGGDPYKPDPPEPLNSRYEKLRKDMADLGLPV